MLRFFRPEKVKCKLCGKESFLISRELGICRECVLEKEEAISIAKSVHESIRKMEGLPPKPPRGGTVKCNLCSNECELSPGDWGFCGLRFNENGKLKSLSSADKGVLYHYLDPHVTNCCAAWFCPAGTGCGYPKFAVKSGPETGYYNLAVFFYGCNFHCLFCQNYSHWRISEGLIVSAEELSDYVVENEKITCICFFGGSPEPQLPFALKFAQLCLEKIESNRVLRICFEWNGCGNRDLVRKAAELAFESGGNIKFDLKCYYESLSYALSGTSNKRAYENFEMVAEEFFEKRKDMPVLTATTLLVPGYVDAEEVSKIAEFIASLDDEIPYGLLVFHPDYRMTDMPITPPKQAYECKRAAERYLKKVHLGNLHLLSFAREYE